jgi:phosphonate transport system permease protein
MTTTAAELSLEERYPSVFRQSFLKRFGFPITLVVLVAYLIYAAWFFNLGGILGAAKWERMEIYLSQWISYDIQADFRIDQPTIAPKYPKNSPLGNNPNPDWVRTSGDGTWEVDLDGTAKSVRFTHTNAVITDGPNAVEIDMSSGKPIIVAGTPFTDIRVYDEEVVADYGFAGEIRVSADRVKVRKKFLGWPNFIFDPSSPMFGRSAGEVIGLIFGGAPIVEGKSNLQVAFNGFWNNQQWQHGDVYIKLLQTITMAFLGTLLGALVAFPLAFLAARNITPNAILNQLFKRAFDFLRCVDMLIWALFFTRAFGPGPLAGSAAVFFTETGTLGKLFSEALENIDDKPREGVTSTGADGMLVQRYGVLPQIVPVIVSQTLYQWESNTRSATIIGAVGAGGIGLKLWEAMRTNSNWANVFYMVILILAVVFIFDNISNALRSRLIGKNQHATT